jgi:chromosome segregation ATPase
MNFKFFQSTYLFILLIGIALFSISCERNGLTRAMKTSTSIQDVDEEIRRMATQIEATSTSLTTLINAEIPDLKNAYDSYSVNLTKLNHQGRIVLKRVNEMKTNSKEYFSEWEKQENTYTNQTIRDLSEQRRTKLANSYDQVRITSAGITKTYEDYYTDLNEIHSFLANDLTPSGINVLKPVTKKANQDLGHLKKSFTPVVDSLNEIREQLYGGNK